jgi:hypothetical protein
MRSLSGLKVGKLKSSLRKFYCRNHDLINRDRIYLLQMTTDIFLLRKIDIISFVIKFHSQQAFTLNFIHRSRHKTDMDVVPFLNSMGYMQ